jgi:hypothetical protein
MASANGHGIGPPVWTDEVPQPAVEGRVPPHDLDAEAAVLSAVMIDPGALDRVNEFLRADNFYSEAHRRIFEAAVDLSATGRPVDVVQVATWLRDHDRLAQVGGMAYLTQVLNAAPAVANVAAYGRTIHEKWRVRQLILACQRVTSQGYAGYGDADAFIEGARVEVSALACPVGESEPPTAWATDLCEPLPDVPMLSAGLTISPGRPTVLAGEGGTRKGWFAMAIQVCGAAGIKLLDRFDFKHELRSVYLDYEQTQRPSQRRYQLLSDGYHVDLASLSKRLGYRWRPIPTLAPKGEAERLRVIDQLSWQVEGIDLAIVDSARACALGTDENAVAASIPFDIATAASEKTGTVFVFLDHAGKPRDDQSSGRTRKHTQRGHSSKLDAGQTLFIFSASKGEPSLVTCERSQLVAEDLWPKDFRFTLQGHNGGLRLHEVLATGAATASSAAKFRQVIEQVRKCIRENPGVAGSEAVVQLVGGTATPIRAAVSTLVGAGEVVERKTGKGKGRRLFLAHDAPPEAA